MCGFSEKGWAKKKKFCVDSGLGSSFPPSRNVLRILSLVFYQRAPNPMKRGTFNLVPLPFSNIQYKKHLKYLNPSATKFYFIPPHS